MSNYAGVLKAEIFSMVKKNHRRKTNGYKTKNVKQCKTKNLYGLEFEWATSV